MEKEIPSHIPIWNQCLEIIKDTVSPEVYSTIFEPINAVSLDNKQLTLELPSLWYKEILEEQYVDLLRTAIRKLLGKDAKLRYKVLMERGQNATQNASITISSTSRKAVKNPLMMPPLDVNAMDRKDIPGPFVVPGIKKQRIPSNLSETLTFDNYVVGDCNRLACAAGMSIAKAPGQTPFNPLFIYSEVGLGKTHLVNAIGIQTKINFPDKIVIYVSADTFYQQYMEAVKSDNLNDFYWFYQAVDMLIIDDIQFISGNKTKTQEAFFQIFNHLHQLKKQIIMTSDKSPVDITGFEPRLLNRFKWGLATDLQAPDLETRTAIITKKLENNGIEFSKEVIDYLALRITANTRELEGAMIAILAQASLNHRDITLDLAREMVDKYVKSTAKEISIEYIQKIVCDYFGISVDAINAKTRKREIVQVRQISMYFAKKYTHLPLSVIGAYCGNKDHATVLHACRTIRNLSETDKKMKQYISDIDKKMKIGNI